ncbi:hypothetical protein C7S18_21040 [Ahniella affigens]|uniref:histidine kinase n=1 Tax=Ahniella affigens TaxID=2021234 RepID=A0A2P1PXD9_9GAMM|nr:ATP-binding protein [Ahniella affigens]AVP99505.1 hypothetical protein C7S18_21040 [Ahniella affigens]
MDRLALRLFDPSVQHIRPVRDAVVAGVVVFLISCLGIALVFHRAMQSNFEAVRWELLQLARTAATTVDPVLHEQLQQTEQTRSATHLQALAPLVRFHQAARNVIYLYTARERNGQIQFVLGTDTLFRVAGDDLPADPIGTPYTGNDRFFREAFATHQEVVGTEIVHERVRSYISAYVPLVDANQRFYGVLGIDMVSTDFEQRMAGIRVAAGYSVLVVSLLAALSAYLIYWFRSGQAKARNREMVQAEAMRLALSKAQEYAVLAEQHATEAERANMAKSEFLAMMSHELRTPMHGVLATTSLLQEKHANPTDQRLLGLIERSGNSLLRIINELLDLAQMEAGMTRFQIEPINPACLLSDVMELSRFGAENKGLELVVHVADDLPQPFYSDGGRFRQVLLNLIGNAIKFTERGQVSVTLVAEGASGVRLSVRDTGIGIPVHAFERLFQTFSQVDGSSRRRFGGTGLGLAICKRLVTLAHGDIGFDSAEGEGSLFWFTWFAEPAPPNEQP